MKWLNKKTILAFAALCVMAPWNQAGAVEGSTKMDVIFPDIVYLHYVPYLELTFTGESRAFEEGKAMDKQEIADSVEFDANMAVTQGPGGGEKGILEVRVDNVWAVRGITKSGYINVGSKLDEGTGKFSKSSAMMSDLLVTSELGEPTIKEEIKVKTRGLAYSKAVKGGIAFLLDITNVKEAGTYEGFKYTISAEPVL